MNLNLLFKDGPILNERLAELELKLDAVLPKSVSN
jgi:hypothetical protein